ncbi:collagenase-like protein with putative collagen-binding domain [Flavobacteriaceae bacterium MAR_2009_75]|nr:collagenase-like protein with putative collagen-binding domain [Flavobacteriaceae bacterium MAR_2009_75]
MAIKNFGLTKKLFLTLCYGVISTSILASCNENGGDGDTNVVITGELKQWHKITVDLDGPFCHETETVPNPFTDFRYEVTFTHESGSPVYKVPGYFAADGNAAITGAKSGNVWRAHLSPDKIGKWTYDISFVTGEGIAISDSQGESMEKFDGKSGSFEILESDKTGRDFRAKGRLQVVGEHYLRFAGNGEYFLKLGADAPENLLAYDDFDATPNVNELRKSWSAHLPDYSDDANDLLWGTNKDKGKALLGAVNYLHNKGMNVFSFLTYNIDGDDHNVYPYLLKEDEASYVAYSAENKGHDATAWEDFFHRDRFDCSKMDQWERIFTYGTRKGMYLHFKTTEAENCLNMDGGSLGPERKLYYRELIARYGHHLALNWNIGEETEQTIEQLKPIIQYISEIDPYNHLIVLHTHSALEEHDKYYPPMLGEASALTGLSVQTRHSDFRDVHKDIVRWVKASAESGKKWVVACDEPGDASHSLITDTEDPTHDDPRKNALWGTLLAGGAGVEWYFGYKHPHSDLTCEDWRSRDEMWNQCKIALDFFKDNEIPFWEMTNEDHLSSQTDSYCFTKKGEVYLVYLKNGGKTQLNLEDINGQFKVEWFNPRSGGSHTTAPAINGGNSVTLIAPDEKDWVAYVHK